MVSKKAPSLEMGAQVRVQNCEKVRVRNFEAAQQDLKIRSPLNSANRGLPLPFGRGGRETKSKK